MTYYKGASRASIETQNKSNRNFKSGASNQNTHQLLEQLVYESFYHKLEKFVINPIPTEGGHFGPGGPKVGSHFYSFMTKVTISHDFVHLSILLVPVKLFLKKEIDISKRIEKKKIYRSDTKGSLWKKSKKIQKIVFFKKNSYFFNLNQNLTCS